MAGIVQKSIIVKGQVHGVWFRQTTLNKANLLNICGYVKNLDDGSVFIEAKGIIEDMGAFIDYCRVGPKDAIVKEVIISHSITELSNVFEFLK